MQLLLNAYNLSYGILLCHIENIHIIYIIRIENNNIHEKLFLLPTGASIQLLLFFCMSRYSNCAKFSKKNLKKKRKKQKMLIFS